MALKQALLRSLEHVATPLSYLPDALRLGPGYVATGRAIRSAERDDPQAAEARVLERLRSLLDHAAKHVPFYRDFYRAKGFDPAGLRSLEDWARVPVVTKHDLQAVPLQARSAPGAGGVLTNTGGTSGAPLGFLLAEGWTPFEWAHMHRIWQARGYRTRHLKLRFGGAHFDDDLPLRYHPRHNEYIVNANCPLPQVAQAAIALSSRRAVRWVHGYPSLVAEFAHALDGQPAADAAGFRHRLFGALLGSEFPAPAYREAIARLLTSNIVSWYGHSEMAVPKRSPRRRVTASCAPRCTTPSTLSCATTPATASSPSRGSAVRWPFASPKAASEISYATVTDAAWHSRRSCSAAITRLSTTCCTCRCARTHPAA